MFEDISGIEIEGGHFGNKTKLLALKKDVKKDGTFGPPRTISIIYGKNGSGKSSIAQAIKEYSTQTILSYNINLLDHGENIINTQNVPISRIFIFNESFIEQNVRFKSDDKLNAIVLLGEQGELDVEINTIETEITKLNELSTHINDKIIELKNSKVITSPFYYKEKIQNNLKGNWAQRESKIKGLKIASQVSEDILSYFLITKNNDNNLDNLEEEYSKNSELLEISKNYYAINPKIEQIRINPSIDTEIFNLLSLSIEKPEFNEREKKIINFIESQKNDEQVKKSEKIFSSEEIDTCPFCFQSVTNEYKTQLLDSISKIFNSETAKLHYKQLDNIKLEHINLQLENYIVINERKVKNITYEIDKYNEIVDEINNLLSQKQANIYTPIYSYHYNIFNFIEKINSLLESLEGERLEFNKKIASSEIIKTKLQQLNKQIALIENNEDCNSYRNQLDLLNQEEEKFKVHNNCLASKKRYVEELKARKSNIHLAIDILNGYLSYIFFNPNRLSIEIDNDGYVVKVRGNKIPLKRLSTGERNAISLCYFFSVLLKNKKKEDFFKDESLIILDDPISSYDFNNKVGIYSFLRKMLNNILNSNPNSRILILTHQLEATFNFQKICADLKINYKAWILENKALSEFSFRKYNEYTYMMDKIFNYANHSADYNELDDSIGNMMRKLLEAFATFNYKKGIDELSCEKEILNLIVEENKREYFNNLMYRLVLHGESHMEYQTREIPEGGLWELTSQDEKIRTAREIMIFLKLLNPLHIKYQLGQECYSKIEKWEQSTFNITL